MVKVLSAISSPTGKGYARLVCSVEQNGARYDNVTWFTKKMPDEVINKEFNAEIETSEWNGKPQYKLAVPKDDAKQFTPRPATSSPASPKNVKVEVLAAVSDSITQWMSHFDVADPMQALDRLVEWVSK